MTSDKRRRAEDFYIRCTQHIANRNLHEAAIDAMLAYAAEAEAAAIARCEAVCRELAKFRVAQSFHMIRDANATDCANAISKLKDAP